MSVTRSGDRDLRRGNASLGSRTGKVGGVRRDIDRIFEGGGAGVGGEEQKKSRFVCLIFLFFWGGGSV